MIKLPLFLLLLLLAVAGGQNFTVPTPCRQSSATPTCSSLLYAQSGNLSLPDLAAVFSANASLARPISRPSGGAGGYLLEVPCLCSAAGGGELALFHDATYLVKSGDTADDITANVFSGLAWKIDAGLKAGETITVHMPCGCLDRQVEVASYAVEKGDTLSTIAGMLAADLEETKRMNSELVANPNFLSVGWILLVPVGTAVPAVSGRKKNVVLALVIAIPVVISIAGLLILLVRYWGIRRRRLLEEEGKKTTAKSASSKKNHSQRNLEEGKAFESERPEIFSVEEVEKAASNFDPSRVIGVGGFGSVYYGMLGEKEVAIKRMKSNKTKEFFAELKVLCKVYHINVVELIGYASGDDHLYLIYEYLQNGSLSDHLHDPLLRGHQPLSWTARAQVALDAARGIEYIHDHTKSRYVHRDIKTSNILLDIGLRAKVGDFGLAKLVERSNDEELNATRLVGTPGYLPPEALVECQTSTKTDVFAFGVVIAELITGCRPLVRDHKEPAKTQSLITLIKKIFQEEDAEEALEEMVDRNLRNSYPMEAIFKMAEVAIRCLDDDPGNRPEMSEITVKLSQILTASIEWEASLGGSGEVFSGVVAGR
ncbi:LysM domain receptor-like kinase 3 [Apostasia shenzhenica]|uniref:LysM domain receptor-like kinase 3 n=1 Tax=Apostasia shenzhenica TaxID=1088818 RepID=A0A2I0BBW5_9ASPA|nr:LysM domain receptor-like kinase 3 [Apostasia shenzhenica]